MRAKGELAINGDKVSVSLRHASLRSSKRSKLTVNVPTSSHGSSPSFDYCETVNLTLEEKAVGTADAGNLMPDWGRNRFHGCTVGAYAVSSKRYCVKL